MAPTDTSTIALTPLARGLQAAPGVASGIARVLRGVSECDRLREGDVLVTHMTSPDWMPALRRVAAIITEAGGITSHAAILARELGIPCVVGTGDAAAHVADGELITVDGDTGSIFAGAPNIQHDAEGAVDLDTDPSPMTRTRIYANLVELRPPEHLARADVDGIGLLRGEFLLLDALEMHPRAMIAAGRGDELVEHLAAQLTTFARAMYPRPVIYRTIDFRTNEFRNLPGGTALEPIEENPMLGFRGCFRAIREPEVLALELHALALVRRAYPTVHLMVPFVRTGWEFAECKLVIDESPLRLTPGLQVWIMAEVPSVVSWLDEYARLGLTGVSIGSNDLTQLVLGVDRDNERLASLYDERDRAVLDVMRRIIEECRRLGLACSICGQAPSMYPELTAQLVAWGIDSISVNPDAVTRTRRYVAEAERARGRR